MKLTGAAILVLRGMKVLQAAPADYPYRSARRADRRGLLIADDLPNPLRPLRLFQ
jgi:hypothetical protein